MARFHRDYCALAVVVLVKLASASTTSDQSECATRTVDAFPNSITKFLSVDNMDTGRGSLDHLAYVHCVFSSMREAEERCLAEQATTHNKTFTYELIGKPFFNFADEALRTRWWLEAQFGVNNAKTLTNLFAAAPPSVAKDPSSSAAAYCSKWEDLDPSGCANRSTSSPRMKTNATSSCKPRCTNCNIWFNDPFFYSLLRSTVESQDDIVAAGACIHSYNATAHCREATVVGLKKSHYDLKSRQWTISTGPCSAGVNRREPWHWDKPLSLFASGRENIEISLVDVVPEPWLTKSKEQAGTGSWTHNYSQVPIPVLTENQSDWTSPLLQCGMAHSTWVQILTAPVVAKCKKQLVSLGVCSESDMGENLTMVGSTWVAVKVDGYKINQCFQEVNISTTNEDYFANSSYCPQLGMICNPPRNASGLGRNAYGCSCPDGFFIDKNDIANQTCTAELGRECYNGSLISEHASQLLRCDANSKNDQLTALTRLKGTFHCRKCQLGCVTCKDSTPCTRENNRQLRIALLTITICSIAAALLLSLVVFKHSHTVLIRSSVPYSLYAILGGAAISYVESIILYFPLDSTVCKLQPWPRHIGFMVIFGALYAKLWRIQVLRHLAPGSVPVSFIDKRIASIIGLYVALMALYLSVWIAISPPEVTLQLEDQGSYQLCSYNWWRYTVHIVEIIILVLLCTLAYATRRIVLDWPEFKFIALPFVNATIIKLLIAIFFFSLMPNKYPDYVYLLEFFDVQFTVTSLLAVVFSNKLYIIFRKGGDREVGPTVPAASSRPDSTLNGTRSPTLAVVDPGERRESFFSGLKALYIPFFDIACHCCIPSETWEEQSETHRQSTIISYMSRTEDSRRVEGTGPSMVNSSEEGMEGAADDGINAAQQSDGDRVLPAVTKPPSAAEHDESVARKKLIPIPRTPKHSNASSKDRKPSSESGQSKFWPIFGRTEPQTSETGACVVQSKVNIDPLLMRRESSV